MSNYQLYGVDDGLVTKISLSFFAFTLFWAPSTMDILLGHTLNNNTSVKFTHPLVCLTKEITFMIVVSPVALWAL